ncbi:MAG TPA: carboxyl transferase [Candidatus Copromonas avistercoris]|nr:carboxyl transferase [Candidatus Copromonas avistercoris]
MEDSKMTKTSAMKRIHELLDDNSFVEVGAYVTARSTDFNMQAQETPGDGVITGYGTIEGALVYVYSQEASVMGGSMGEMHAAKIEKLYHMAMKTGAPVIGLLDCAGLRLQEGIDALNGFGRLYLCQTMASGVIPQIQAVFGTCGGGMAVASAMADFTFMEEKANLFVNAPNAIVSNDTDTSDAKFQSEEAGNVCMTGTEEEILSAIHTLVSVLPANNEDDLSYDECGDDLNRLCEGLESFSGDTAAALALISDDGFYMEMKKAYAPSMVTAFIRLNGTTVGCVANRSESLENGEKTAEYGTELTAQGCEKAAEFVTFCDAFNIPVLTLVNTTGYKGCKCTEKKIAKAAARMTYAFANADVPKVTVMIGKANGTAGLSMNSKSIGADIVYAWKDASMSMMDAAPAVKIMYAKEIEASENPGQLIKEKTAEYSEKMEGIASAAKRGFIDDIIPASETRQRVIAAFEMLFTKREDRPSKKHGTI